MSVCFWFTLLLAAILYGAVALSPKFAVWAQARQAFRTNARHLVELESDIEYLERVDSALKTDDEMAQQIVGMHAPQPESGATTEDILVSGSLMFGRDDLALPTVAPTEATWFDRSVFVTASSGSLRTFLLVSAAVLVVFAFTFLNDAGEGLVTTSGRALRSAAMLPVKRYFAGRSEPTEIEDDASNSAVEPQQEEDEGDR